MPIGPKGEKRPRDTNQLAKFVIDAATGECDNREPTPKEEGKNPKAVAIGRLGGIKGGKARAEHLSKERRSEIAKHAATTRWKKDRVGE
jgi:hypothetical protein